MKKSMKLYSSVVVMLVMLAVLLVIGLKHESKSGEDFTSQEETLIATVAPTETPEPTKTPEPTTAPTDTPKPTKTPERQLTEFEKYNNMSESEQLAFFNSFSDPSGFFAWLEKAQAEYEAQKDVIVIDGNSEINMEDIFK